jgi:hypothetical protein
MSARRRETKDALPPAVLVSLAPSARVRTNPIVASAIKEFELLLDSRGSEERVRRFLVTHLFFWNGLVRAGSQLYSKIALGTQHEIDFVWCDPTSSGAEWHVAEIESPSARLFTKAGNPSHSLTHALTQVRDWQNWIGQHAEYANELMPGIYEPMGHVFIGRRNALGSPAFRARLNEMNVQNRAHARVHTLDKFIDLAFSVLTWDPSRFPPRALGDKELRTRVRDGLFQYALSPMGSSRGFLGDRQRRDVRDDEVPLKSRRVPKTVTVTRVLKRPRQRTT